MIAEHSDTLVVLVQRWDMQKLEHQNAFGKRQVIEPTREYSLSTTIEDTPSSNMAHSTTCQIALECQEVNQTMPFIFLQNYRVHRMK